MQVKILPAARERLLGIWQYTFNQWGDAQADDYVGGLVAAVQALPGRQDQWRPVKEKRFAGIYLFRYRHHYIFLKILEDGALGILSILQENMDFPNRLRDDFD